MTQPYLLKSFLFFFFVSLGIGVVSCKKPTDPDSTPGFSITVEDVSCIEAWVRVKSEGLKLPTEIIITKNKIPALNFTMTTADTVVIIDSLLPKQSYTFHAFRSDNLKAAATAQCTTMDTTSHNFTWQTFTFGEHSSSILRDVALIDENNFWAVGEIFLRDSLENADPHIYNAVHWDGRDWKFHKVEYYSFCPQQTGVGIYPASSVFTFTNNEVVISSTSQIAYLINGNQTNRECIPVSIDKIWGASNKDILVVGYGGGIGHYNGTSWTTIVSGTSLNIGDICGIPDGTGGFNKYCATEENILIVDRNNKITPINAGPNMYFNLIWGKSNRLIYTAGNGVVLYKNYKWEKIDRPDLNTVYGIKGCNYNDVFGFSSTGKIFHFNGYCWQNVNTSNNIYKRLDVKENIMAAVGWQGDKAVITVLKRE